MLNAGVLTFREFAMHEPLKWGTVTCFRRTPSPGWAGWCEVSRVSARLRRALTSPPDRGTLSFGSQPGSDLGKSGVVPPQSKGCRTARDAARLWGVRREADALDCGDSSPPSPAPARGRSGAEAPHSERLSTVPGAGAEERASAFGLRRHDAAFLRGNWGNCAWGNGKLCLSQLGGVSGVWAATCDGSRHFGAGLRRCGLGGWVWPCLASRTAPARASSSARVMRRGGT
jgi:hypothetical protein